MYILDANLIEFLILSSSWPSDGHAEPSLGFLFLQGLFFANFNNTSNPLAVQK